MTFDVSRNPLGGNGIDLDRTPDVLYADRAPTTADVPSRPTIWIYKATNTIYMYTTGGDGSANWEIMGPGTTDDALPMTATVSLTSAQVKALATTQIELVAAPGAGKMIQFESATLKLDYAGTNVFAETADNLAIKYTDDSGVAVSQTIEMTGFIDQTADTYTNAEPAINAIVAASAAENQALVLDNINDNITGNAGNDNTLEVSVLYRVVTI